MQLANYLAALSARAAVSEALAQVTACDGHHEDAQAQHAVNKKEATKLAAAAALAASNAISVWVLSAGVSAEKAAANYEKFKAINVNSLVLRATLLIQASARRAIVKAELKRKKAAARRIEQGVFKMKKGGKKGGGKVRPREGCRSCRSSRRWPPLAAACRQGARLVPRLGRSRPRASLLPAGSRWPLP